MKLIAGTDKGLLIYQKQGSHWKLRDIAFVGLPIGAFLQDHAKRWWVAINHKHWGSKLYVSDNQGENFREVKVPTFNKESEHSLKSIWTIEMQQIGPIERLFIGTEPAALFYSDDLGENFQELTGLTSHPSRPTWQGGGKGSKNPFLHSLVFHPEDSNQLMVGISCAGVFQSADAGNTWQPTNKGLEAFYLPNSTTEVGHDPHSMIRHPKDPEVIWQQNHCGIYRSMDSGNSWSNVSDPHGKAVYGFDLTIDEEDINRAWVIPAQSDDLRIPAQNKLSVYRTDDAGKNWTALRNGLPQEAAFDLVLRHAFAKQSKVLAFGTNNGNLYVSNNEGEEWQILSQSLSAVRVVRLVD